MSSYIALPKSPEDHLSNVQFQLDNIRGYLNSNLRGNAAVKAECLEEEAKKLVEAFLKEMGTKRKLS